MSERLAWTTDPIVVSREDVRTVLDWLEYDSGRDILDPDDPIETSISTLWAELNEETPAPTGSYPSIPSDAPEFGAIDEATVERLVPAINTLISMVNTGRLEADDLATAGGLARTWVNHVESVRMQGTDDGGAVADVTLAVCDECGFRDVRLPATVCPISDCEGEMEAGE